MDMIESELSLISCQLEELRAQASNDDEISSDEFAELLEEHANDVRENGFQQPVLLEG